MINCLYGIYCNFAIIKTGKTSYYIQGRQGQKNVIVIKGEKGSGGVEPVCSS